LRSGSGAKPSCCSQPYGTSRYCVQRIYLTCSPYNLYECYTWDNGCQTDPAPYDDIYCGPIHGNIPESCYKLQPDCETDNSYGGGHVPQGHKLQVTDETTAWNSLKHALEHNYPTNGQPDYYIIPDVVTNLGRDVYAVVFKVPQSATIVGDRYVGLEMDNSGEPFSSPTSFSWVKAGPGAKLLVDCMVGPSNNQEPRRLQIWLKTP
jgi:hypothetical protein